MSQIVLEGNVRRVLQDFPDGFFHCAVTSPPYYGLRNYGTDGQVWGGDPNCTHDWNEVHPPGYRGSDTKPGPMQHEGNKNRENLTSNTCMKCGAWKGELGLEPTPDMYVQHLVEIFRELRRVLRDDGVLWLNIGDSYAGGGGASGHTAETKNLGSKTSEYGAVKSGGKTYGLKPKDLIGIPWLLAFTLRADGWYLRADLPWIKRNSMPSSVRDRPSSSIEHVFLLAKSQKYYYDYVAAMQPVAESSIKRVNQPNFDNQSGGEKDYGKNGVNPSQSARKGIVNFKNRMVKQDALGKQTYTGFNDRYEDPGTGLRFMRDSDFFFRTWQGMLHNENGEPMALVVNPRGYKGAHFACFPVQLVEPMILAGTSEKGVCPECGAPWVRLAKKTFVPQEDVKDPSKLAKGSNKGMDESNGWGETPRGSNSFETTGWAPSCSCNAGEPVPARVSDLFAGSCSTGVACYWNNRDFYGIELKHEYCELGRKRMQENK